jgi:hypothetical protein
MLPHPAIILGPEDIEIEATLLRLSTNSIDIDGVKYPDEVGVLWIQETNEFVTVAVENIKMAEPLVFAEKLASIGGLVKN